MRKMVEDGWYEGGGCRIGEVTGEACGCMSLLGIVNYGRGEGMRTFWDGLGYNKRFGLDG